MIKKGTMIPVKRVIGYFLVGLGGTMLFIPEISEKILGYKTFLAIVFLVAGYLLSVAGRKIR